MECDWRKGSVPEDADSKHSVKVQGIQTTIQRIEALTLAKIRFNLPVNQQSQWVVKVCVSVCC